LFVLLQLGEVLLLLLLWRRLGGVLLLLPVKVAAVEDVVVDVVAALDDFARVKGEGSWGDQITP
jgi:hypothetical protein